MTMVWIAVAVVVTVLAAWAYNTAQRLNRLHIRLDRSRDALQAALDRRCAVIAALYPELGAAAQRTEQIRLGPDDVHTRFVQEKQLSAVVAERIAGEEMPGPLSDADIRVELATRFYNDAVADTRALRLRPSVSFLRLGGTAALPQFVRDDQ
ncbi:hypothetical protein NUW87_00885 [Corynebacterium pilbarense]|uniref:Secreted protein n=1 Tax=Corynebacterium pilbarense TaxID=1288393 RepID=A0A9Q4IFD8_9CORY|nr:hypothetical protein [Corynebacterium pilbarense]MCZ2219931.1 hypothetical protein [Corynebacterium pilbarense]